MKIYLIWSKWGVSKTTILGVGVRVWARGGGAVVVGVGVPFFSVFLEGGGDLFASRFLFNVIKDVFIVHRGVR